MGASNIRHRNRMNTTDSVSHSFLPKLYCDVFSKSVKSFDGITKKFNFAVNLQILSLVKFDFLPGQKTVEDSNIEQMSAVSNDCIKFDEAMLGSGRMQKERAISISPNKIYTTTPELNLESSKPYRSELFGFIYSSLNSTVRRIAYLDHCESFSEPRISYSELLRISCRNLSAAFNRSQDCMMSRCSHQSDDHVLPVELGDYRRSACPVTGGEAVGFSTSPYYASQDCSEQNIGEVAGNDTATNQTGLANLDMKSHEKCTKAVSHTTDSIYLDSVSCSCHTIAANKSEKVVVTRNSKDLDKNLLDFVCSSFSMNDAMTLADSSHQLADCPSRTLSTIICDKKVSSRKHRRIRLHSAQQYFGWRDHKFCRKRNSRHSKSRAKFQDKCRPQLLVAGDGHSSVGSDDTGTDVEYLFKEDISLQKEGLGSNLKLSLAFIDHTEVINYVDGEQTCLQERDDETGDDDNLAHEEYCIVTDDKERDDKVTDEENTGDEEMDEDEVADDELNSESTRDEDATDEESGEKELNGKAVAFIGSMSKKADITSASIKTFCKSSFFISPSEIDSSDSSSDWDDEDDNHLEVDAWNSSENRSLDALSSGICESFSFNGLYFPSSCSPIEAKLSLEELKETCRAQLSSASGTPYAIAVDCSEFDSSYDDIVFCDDQESLSVGSEDDEDLQLPNLSRLQSINAKWNHIYSTSREVEKPAENKKQVHFARDSSLVTTYAETMSEAEDYAAARKGPWEEYARDRGRFARRMQDTAEQISWVLSHSHRNKVYRNWFSES